MADNTIHTETAGAITEVQTEVQPQEKMSRALRYYMLHRDVCLARSKANYEKRQDVIQRREEKEKKRAEKEAAKEQKRIEKERKMLERLEILEKAKATSKKRADGE